MSLSDDLRDRVRVRSRFACEFCGVTETDVGGELTIDHFRPLSKGGAEELENLLYCCVRCNQYKADYWEAKPDLWNPRQASSVEHFLLLSDGKLHPLTEVGAFTLRRLRLNRFPLVNHRRRQQTRTEENRLLAQYQTLVNLLTQIAEQQARLLEEQRALLEEQKFLLTLLLSQRREDR